MAAPQPAPQQQMDTKKWPVVYPAYIDADKTIALVRPPTRRPALRAAGWRSALTAGCSARVPQGRKLSKKDAVPFKFRGLMSVNTPNGPLYVDKTAFDVRPR